MEVVRGAMVIETAEMATALGRLVLCQEMMAKWPGVRCYPRRDERSVAVQAECRGGFRIRGECWEAALDAALVDYLVLMAKKAGSVLLDV